MLNSVKTLTKYIRYLFVVIVVIAFSRHCVAGTLLSGRSIKLPFTSDSMYVPDGQSLNGVDIIDEDGKNYSVSDFKGKVLVVLFSTTWCPNCPDAIIALDRLQARMNRDVVQNVVCIHLNIDDGTQFGTLNMIKYQHKAHDIRNLAIYRSVPGRSMGKLQVVPSFTVIDKNGKSVWGYQGLPDILSGKFIGFIKALAKE